MPYQTSPIITKPPKTTMDQFLKAKSQPVFRIIVKWHRRVAHIVTAVTGIAGGKNEKKTERTRKTTLKPFTATPTGPIFHGP